MAKEETLTKVGSWAFLIGIVIALIVGLWTAVTIENRENLFTTETGGYIAWLLAVIGAIVGILAVLGKGTITGKEVPGFLLAGIALVVMYGVFAGVSIPLWIGSLLQGVSLSLSIFVAPAVGLLALKAIWDMGKSV